MDCWCHWGIPSQEHPPCLQSVPNVLTSLWGNLALGMS